MFTHIKILSIDVGSHFIIIVIVTPIWLRGAAYESKERHFVCDYLQLSMKQVELHFSCDYVHLSVCPKMRGSINITFRADGTCLNGFLVEAKKQTVCLR